MGPGVVLGSYFGMLSLVGSRNTQHTQRYSQNGSSDAVSDYQHCSISFLDVS